MMKLQIRRLNASAGSSGYETDINELDERWKELYWEQYSHVYRLDLSDEELSAYGLIP